MYPIKTNREGIYIGKQCSHIEFIQELSVIIPQHYHNNLKQDEYLKDLNHFIEKWYGSYCTINDNNNPQ